MTALPAPDAPAEEWGAFAESIPGWRNPSPTAVLDSLAMPRIEVGFPIGDLSSPRFVIDPDHWAWEGWLLKLLGNLEEVDKLADDLHLRRDQCPSDAVIDAVVSGDSSRINRAAIAAAAALGRWPGGEG
jgi:hypothetical protein